MLSPICVASSSTPEQIRNKLEITGLLARFGENLFSATMVARGKPAPDLFLRAAARFGAEPRRCLVIEESLAGIDAAHGPQRRGQRVFLLLNELAGLRGRFRLGGQRRRGRRNAD